MMNSSFSPLIKPCKNLAPEQFVAYFKAKKPDIDRDLLLHGAVKFTDVVMSTADDFRYIVNAISDNFLNYIDGNSPRSKVSDFVYTSTEYDKSQQITMHNELSYSAKWPGQLFFCCLRRALQGGETLLADSREILARMDRSIVSMIEEKGVLYIRNLNSGKGLGPSWQSTFETEDKKAAEHYCRSYGIRYEWGDDDNLKLLQFSKGIIRHRITGDRLWFNQIDQFHPCQLGEEMYETLKMFYDQPQSFPMYVTFGDGQLMEEAMIHEIKNTIEKLTLAPLWRTNELLIVDNERVCHGRNAFTGDRTVLVAMSE